jgi:hypothetical protein
MYENHIIMCGAPRSGTTALAKALHHRYPAFTNELNIYALLVDPYNTRADVLKKVNSITQRRWGFELDCRLDACKTPLAFLGEIRRTLLEQFSKKEYSYFEDISEDLKTELRNDHEVYEKSNRYCGDKDPFYTLIIGHIASVFKDAKYIYIERDGREVAASLLRLNWAHSIEHAFTIWESYVKCWLTSKPSLPSFIEVKQHNLLYAPSKVQEQINEYLQDDLPVEYFKAYVHKNGTSEHMPEGFNPVEFKRDYWRDVFTEDDIPEFAKSLLVQRGYY